MFDLLVLFVLFDFIPLLLHFHQNYFSDAQTIVFCFPFNFFVFCGHFLENFEGLVYIFLYFYLYFGWENSFVLWLFPRRRAILSPSTQHLHTPPTLFYFVFIFAYFHHLFYVAPSLAPRDGVSPDLAPELVKLANCT